MFFAIIPFSSKKSNPNSPDFPESESLLFLIDNLSIRKGDKKRRFWQSVPLLDKEKEACYDRDVK